VKQAETTALNEEAILSAHSSEEDPILEFFLRFVLVGVFGVLLGTFYPELWILAILFAALVIALNTIDTILKLRRIKSLVFFEQEVLVVYRRRTYRIPYDDLLLVGWALEDSANNRRHFIHKALDGKTEIIEYLRERGRVKEI
jgi:hypothetical protein